MNQLSVRLEEFSIDVVRFCRDMQADVLIRPLLSQLIRSATSIGANYSESQGGISRKDFRAKVYIALKEAEETKYWLRVLGADIESAKLTELTNESLEIVKVLQAIVPKLNTAISVHMLDT